MAIPTVCGLPGLLSERLLMLFGTQLVTHGAMMIALPSVSEQPLVRLLTVTATGVGTFCWPQPPPPGVHVIWLMPMPLRSGSGRVIVLASTTVPRTGPTGPKLTFIVGPTKPEPLIVTVWVDHATLQVVGRYCWTVLPVASICTELISGRTAL